MSKQRLPTSWDDVPVMFDLPYACVLLGLSYEWLKRLAEQKKVPAHKVGKGWRFEKTELLEWFKSDKREAVT